ncbi:hypothetical protein BG58_22280 [Caballeronia jiangsuensis]|nr:hypothetical protein BG58_22280 [Caballeronia jiangsuensis]
MATTWLVWGPQGAGTFNTLNDRFKLLRRVITICNRNETDTSHLSRFPVLINAIADAITAENSRKVLLFVFDRLHRARGPLGFELLDEAGMRQLSQIFSQSNYRDPEQTAYIPARIWTYQVTRLRECLDDFIAHQNEFEACFAFCVDAYRHNFGSLSAAVGNHDNETKLAGRNPFKRGCKDAGKRNGCKFYGKFEDTAKKFGVVEILQKWVRTPTGQLNITQFSSYLSLIQHVGLAYVGNFTLQRMDEFAELLSDCLEWEEDPSLGWIPTICGPTTKTDRDSDARWPTSPSVEVAVRALTSVSKMRLTCGIESKLAVCREQDATIFPLLTHSFEPWSANKARTNYSVRPALGSYGLVMKKYPRLFDVERMRITQEDLDTARLFTPNINKNGSFSVGKVWPLAYHQNRRTVSVNMFASGLLSDGSMQVILKHLTLLQSRYYGKNFSRLRFHHEWEEVTISARYEVMAKQLQTLTEERYISPYGEAFKSEMILNLVGQKDFDHLVKEGAKGKVMFRAIRLGGCTNRDNCSYGGIESISRCTGGDGDKPCPKVIYDRMKRPSAQRQLDAVERKLKSAQANSHRARALEAEAQGLRNFLNDTKE